MGPLILVPKKRIKKLVATGCIPPHTRDIKIGITGGGAGKTGDIFNIIF
jgi:hypothetical protein